MATASAIKDGLITVLSSASVIGPNQVSTNYAVMESNSACCAIVNLSGYENDALTFGNNRGATYTFLIEARIKDRGDPVTAMNEVYSLFDKIKVGLKDNDTVNGTANAIGPVRAERDPKVVYTTGNGATWLPIDILVDIIALDD